MIRHPETYKGAPIYTEEELEKIRQTIVWSRAMPESEAEAVAAAVGPNQCPTRLAPFWGLTAASPELFEKLGQDRHLETYSIYGFFPGVYQLVYERSEPPQISLSGRSRGRVAIVRDGANGLVVKPMQSHREGEIAAIAGALGLGPRQYPSLPGFISEEFVPGIFFTELPPEGIKPGDIYQLGRNLGGMIAALHSSQIFYNDATLSDPSGRSHLLVSADGSCRLIDFGVSLLLDRHPELSREEVYNFVRTLPLFRIFAGMGVTQSQIHQFLDHYRQRLAQASKEEILARDLQFMEEGLLSAAQRLGRPIIEPFRQGFKETYGYGSL